MLQNKFKIGQEIDLEILDLAFGGKGIAKLNNLTVFVKSGIPGQTISARITKIKKSYLEAKHIKTLKKSKFETKPKCDHFPTCGGCSFQQLSYKKQLEYKQKQIYDIFERIGEVQKPKINKIIGSNKKYYYRNKMEFTFSDNPWYIADESYDKIVLGLHVPKRFDKILNVDDCHIQDKIFNDILKFIREKSIKLNLEPYNVRKHVGLLRYLIFKIGIYTNEIMLNIVTAKEENKIIKLSEIILKEFPKITTIVNTINSTKSNTAIGQKEHIIYGKGYINEKIGKYKFRISPSAFFQTNSFQVKTLYDYILKISEINKEDVIFDLFSGTGTIAIYLANKAKKAYGFEIVEDAVNDANINAKNNNIDNVIFYLGDIKNLFDKKNDLNIEKPDIVIIDPPRPGLHLNTIKYLLKELPKKIIYVSCNATTQARDMNLLIEKYSIIDIQPIDLFPHTPHIENILTLLKK
tara:strand:- start:101 stop:1492 length:1392 start_codon:yes stop_codon:yes gene_type:complete